MFAVVDEVQPDRWHAEVSYFGHTVLITDQFDTDKQAVRAAEERFISRVVQLLDD